MPSVATVWLRLESGAGNTIHIPREGERNPGEATHLKPVALPLEGVRQHRLLGPTLPEFLVQRSPKELRKGVSVKLPADAVAACVGTTLRSAALYLLTGSGDSHLGPPGPAAVLFTFRTAQEPAPEEPRRWLLALVVVVLAAQVFQGKGHARVGESAKERVVWAELGVGVLCPETRSALSRQSVSAAAP